MDVQEHVLYQDKGNQSGTGMLRFRTEVRDAGMPMPAASASMPMPSYENFQKYGIFPKIARYLGVVIPLGKLLR
jgi:hypothetical protein